MPELLIGATVVSIGTTLPEVMVSTTSAFTGHGEIAYGLSLIHISGERYRAVGKAMGVMGIDEMNDVEAADATIAAVKQLSADVGIPANLHLSLIHI